MSDTYERVSDTITRDGTRKAARIDGLILDARTIRLEERDAKIKELSSKYDSLITTLEKMGVDVAGKRVSVGRLVTKDWDDVRSMPAMNLDGRKSAKRGKRRKK